MPAVELAAGPIEYIDTGGDGPVLVFTHGFPMTGSQWRKVTPQLTEYRCLLPTLPLGAHRVPMRPGTDLSQRGQAHILADFLDALNLSDVTVIMNDWGGPQFLISEGRIDRVARMVFVACEAFDNFPPRPARPLIRLCAMPGGAWLMMQLLRTRLVRHNPRAYGGLSLSGLPDEILDEWFAPATGNSQIRRDLASFATGTPSRATLLKWSDQLGTFDRPALVVWARQDRMMPLDHGRRLAALLPQARLIEIDKSSTLTPEDQPDPLAQALRNFLDTT